MPQRPADRAAERPAHDVLGYGLEAPGQPGGGIISAAATARNG
ncbi:hypothetical protein [Pseudonocardia sp. MH-G8]|nr:hypothetical protein [Pseudonocardia sp. MH-G8]